MLGRPSMGGPTGFAVVTTTTTTTTVDMRLGTSAPTRFVHVFNTSSIPMRRFDYINVLVSALDGPQTGRTPASILQQYIPTNNVYIDTTTFNHGVARYANVCVPATGMFADMISLLSTAKDKDFRVLNDDLGEYFGDWGTHLDGGRYRDVSPRNDRRFPLVAGTLGVVVVNDWSTGAVFVDALRLVPVEFFHEFVNPTTNAFMRCLRRAVTRRFLGSIEQVVVDGIPTPEYVVVDGSDMRRFLSTNVAMQAFPYVDDAYRPNFRGLQVELCVASLRVLCTLCNDSLRNEVCISNIPIISSGHRVKPLLVHILTGGLDTPGQGTYFRPPAAMLYDYLVYDAKILTRWNEYIPESFEETVTTVRRAAHTFWFVLALVHAACQLPYINEETATRNMSVWFPPLLDAAVLALDEIRDGLAYAATTLRRPIVAVIDSDVTRMMRRRVAQALRIAGVDDGEEEGDHAHVSSFDDVLWWRPPELDAAATTTTTTTKRLRLVGSSV